MLIALVEATVEWVRVAELPEWRYTVVEVTVVGGVDSGWWRYQW